MPIKTIRSISDDEKGWSLKYEYLRSGINMTYRFFVDYWTYVRVKRTCTITLNGETISKSVLLDNHSGYHEGSVNVGVITAAKSGSSSGETTIPGTYSFYGTSGSFDAVVMPGGVPSVYRKKEGVWQDAKALMTKQNGEYSTVSGIRITKILVPEGFREVSWIGSSGAQYINTGLKVSNTLSGFVDFQLTERPSAQCGIFGGRRSASSNQFMTAKGSSSTFSNHFIARYGSNYRDSGVSSSDMARHTISLDQNKLYFDGTLKYTFTAQTFSDDIDVFLFALNLMDSGGVDQYSSMKLYSAYFNDSDVPVRSFIPCVRISDSKPGLYDSVGNTFYTNLGSGEFSFE